MTAQISWTGPEGSGEWTGELPVTLGREGDVRVADAEASRQHARLEASRDPARGAVLTLIDLGSANGTFVDGARVKTADLGTSGAFRIGRAALTVSLLPEIAHDADATRIADPDATRMAPPKEEPAAPELEPVMDEPPMLLVRWTHTESGESGEARLAPPATVGRGDAADLTLAESRVSTVHATLDLEREGGGYAIVVRDEGSTNGTYIGAKKVERAVLGTSGEVTLRPYTLAVSLEGIAAEPEGASVRTHDEDPGTVLHTPSAPAPDATILGTPEARPQAASAPASAQASGDATILGSPEAEIDARDGSGLRDEDASIVFDADVEAPPARRFPSALFDAPVVSVAALMADGKPVLQTDYAAIGGGLGSFVWVDMLRIGGVPTGSIAVLGLEHKPHARYERLCINSQIPDHERLRSDSGSCPDCIWGWPGYAVREAWKETFNGDAATAARALWKIFNEPTFATTYTPRSGEVFRSIDVEAQRIGWGQMLHRARVRAIRKTDDGRYAIAYTAPPGEPDRERYALARFAHVAVGYPGIRLLPDLQAYRRETGDMRRVVNAYEEHEHVYDHLRKHGGTVVLRGWGIVASRIIQTLWEARQATGANIQVLHLTRTIVGEGNAYRHSQRETDNNWEFQPFNWPKACWGGDLRFLLEESGPAQRAALLKDWGGTTTADREDWREMVVEGLQTGWYHIREGEVDHVEPGPDGAVRTVIKGKKTIQDTSTLDADFILDCTGLVSTIESNPLLKDLVEHHGLGRNVQNRLDVADDFEIRGMRNAHQGAGRIYASGVATLGGPYAPVDSFLGLQYSAQRSVDAMERARAPHLRHLSAGRSLSQWMKWAKGKTPEGHAMRPPPPQQPPHHGYAPHHGSPHYAAHRPHHA